MVLVLVGGLIYTVFGVYHRSWIESGRNQVPESRLYSPPEDWDNPVRLVSDGVSVVEGTVLFSDGNLNENPQAFIVRSQQSGVVSIRGEDVIVLPSLTLDGGSTMIDRDDFNVVMCLSNLVAGDEAVVAEAVRDAYSARYGRVGALTGIPIVLGWENHQRQWRGATYSEVAGSRRQDMDKLYSDPRMDAVIDIIARYDINYILYGVTERAQYGGAGEEKFINNLPIVCESGESRVFFVDRKLELSEIR